MDLKTYFSQHKGAGILATADASGKVDVAVYARPHVKDDETIAFIMRDRLSHQNLQSNPQTDTPIPSGRFIGYPSIPSMSFGI